MLGLDSFNSSFNPSLNSSIFTYSLPLGVLYDNSLTITRTNIRHNFRLYHMIQIYYEIKKAPVKVLHAIFEL